MNAQSRARTSTAAVPVALVPVPPVLRQVVGEWRAAGSPPQPGTLWPRDLWLTDLPQHADLFRGLPTLLARADVRAACAGAADDANSAERAFVAVMVWGFGSVGYSRFRTANMLLTPHAPDRLLAVAQTLATAGPIAAYRCLADRSDCGVDGLGPSFGTKFLYFCQPSGAETTALILDKLVSDWILENAGLALQPQPWSDRRYEAYLRQMHAWANELECAPDEVEQCIFQAQANEQGGQWSTSSGGRPRKHGPGEPAIAGAQPVLSTVELAFHQAMLDIYWLAGRETGYWASYFLRAVRNNGGLPTARKLLWASGTSEGFERLKKEGRLDLSMEAVMLRPEFRELFSAEELARAADRLAANGYRVPSKREAREGGSVD